MQPSFTYTPSTDASFPPSDPSFTTPQRLMSHQTSTPVTPVTPATPSESDNSYNISEVGSLGNSPMDILAPSMTGMKLGSGCGWPRKELIPPSYDDAPQGPSAKELTKWKKG